MEYSLKFVSRDLSYWVNAMEAVLFAGGDPIPREKFAQLFDITKVEVGVVADELDKRLVSNTGRKSKFFVMDNVVGAFSSDVLARYITSDTLSGRVVLFLL